QKLQDVAHPNLVALDELVQTDRDWFFTMELVEGLDLLEYLGRRADLVDRDPCPPTLLSAEGVARLRPALCQLAEGVQVLHDEGLPHRDVKPSNVRVTPDGRVVLLDFGVALELDDWLRSQPGAAGTVAYMSPEQAEGRHDRANDWYSIGVMLYQALTG